MGPIDYYKLEDLDRTLAVNGGVALIWHHSREISG